MKITPAIRPTSDRERARGAGKLFVGFRVSMNWAQASQIIEALKQRIKSIFK